MNNREREFSISSSLLLFFFQIINKHYAEEKERERGSLQSIRLIGSKATKLQLRDRSIHLNSICLIVSLSRTPIYTNSFT